MTSKTTKDFWLRYDKMPLEIQTLAKKTYALWHENPNHPSLYFSPLEKSPSVYRVKITKSYRALGNKDNNIITWFWIGSHSDYNRELKK